MIARVAACWLAMLWVVTGGGVAAAAEDEIGDRILKALPTHPYSAPPDRGRNVLIFTRTLGYRHDSIPVGIRAIASMGRYTGAYESVESEDPAMFERDALAAFDAVILLNTTGEFLEPGGPSRSADTPKAQQLAAEVAARRKENLLEFVRDGKGLVGIHAAADSCYHWPQYGELLGGWFDGHPWNANDEVTLRIDDPRHALCGMFHSPTMKITDEIYQFREPFARDRQRVIVRLDTALTPMDKPGIKRTDGDFAVSWLRREGRGRVFYCALGHREDIYWNPVVLRHYLAGIQYAIGDYAADDRPVPMPTAAAAGTGGWKELFNGRDLSGWKGLVGDPLSRAAMSREELAAAQAKADELMRKHWSVKDGVLHFDGAKSGSHLCTIEEFGDFDLELEWKIEAGGDSGIYLRGCPQVQIWDAGLHPEGSGGLYNNQRGGKDATEKADRAVGEWNRFHIAMRGDRVTVRLNGRVVVNDIALENFWKRGEPIPVRGQLELQSHESPLWFRNVRIRPIVEEPPATTRPTGSIPP